MLEAKLSEAVDNLIPVLETLDDGMLAGYVDAYKSGVLEKSDEGTTPFYMAAQKVLLARRAPEVEALRERQKVLTAQAEAAQKVADKHWTELEEVENEIGELDI